LPQSHRHRYKAHQPLAGFFFSTGSAITVKRPRRVPIRRLVALLEWFPDMAGPFAASCVQAGQAGHKPPVWPDFTIAIAELPKNDEQKLWN
jgi:hypothetical protein